MRISLLSLHVAKSFTYRANNRAHDPSTMAVVSQELNSVWFDVPSGQETGFSKLEVVANGIASEPVFVYVSGNH